MDTPHARWITCTFEGCKGIVNEGKPYCRLHHLNMPYVIELTGSVEYSEYLHAFNLPPGPPDPLTPNRPRD